MNVDDNYQFRPSRDVIDLVLLTWSFFARVSFAVSWSYLVHFDGVSTLYRFAGRRNSVTSVSNCYILVTQELQKQVKVVKFLFSFSYCDSYTETRQRPEHALQWMTDIQVWRLAKQLCQAATSDTPRSRRGLQPPAVTGANLSTTKRWNV